MDNRGPNTPPPGSPGGGGRPGPREGSYLLSLNAALRDAESLLRGVFDQAAVGIEVISPDGRWQRINDALCQQLGYRVEDLLATVPTAIIHPDDVASERALLHEMVTGTRNRAWRSRRLFAKSGETLSVWTATTAVRDERGGLLYLLSETVDLSSVVALKGPAAVARGEEQKHADGSELLRSLAFSACETDDADDFIQMVLDKFCAYGGWQIGHALINDRMAYGVQFISARLWHLEGRDRFATFRSASEDQRFWPGSGLPGRAALSGRPEWITSLTADQSFRRLREAKECGLNSAVACPVIAESAVVAVLEFFSTAEKPPDDAQMQILRQVCLLIGRVYERKKTEHALAESRDFYASQLRRFPLMVWRCDQDEQFDFFSDNWLQFSGRTLDQEIGQGWMASIHADDRDRVLKTFHAALGARMPFELEFRLRRFDGEYRWIFTIGSPYADVANQYVGYIGCSYDITERKKSEETLRHGAFHDPLTQLPNRTAFLEMLERAIARCHRIPNYRFAVLFLDLDRFKIINDSLGHTVGDKLLVEVAARLKLCLRLTDVVARLGGDEFVILLDYITTGNEAADSTRTAERIIKSLTAPFGIDGNDIYSGASIGIALSESGYQKSEDILRDADIAMYRAKTSGKGRCEIFDSAMHDRAVTLLHLETDLRHAIERQEFELFYQPIVSLLLKQIVGFEALIRWRHPERGLVSPAEFIPIAEETGLIVPIGNWALREACQWMRSWQNEQSVSRRLTISVNVSGRQFSQPDLTERIAEVLKETGLDPRSLKLEITESTVMAHADKAKEMLNKLKTLNVELQIDDFGTGYSSLAYLHRFPIDALKIDRSFIADISSSEESPEIVRAVLALAGTLHMDVVAEGVETRDQVDKLSELGCELAQGYYFSRPVDSDRARQLLVEGGVVDQ